MTEQLLYQIALTLVPGIGPKNAKVLIAHCGGAREVFEESPQTLHKIGGIGEKTIQSLSDKSIFERAEKEIDFIEKNGIIPLFYLNQDYPGRLKLCEDGPILLYYQGNADLNKRQVIAIVGTRSATDYGKNFCETFIQDLKPFNPLIISGLAYGIDVWAHRQALAQGLPTVGVLGHGLDRIYPFLNKPTAKKMLQNGGLLTEFLSETNPDRENFPKRNRIVAGIADAVVVVEAAKKGGALITAKIANTYNREVFAVPGSLKATFSQGCNHLIKTNQAVLLTGAEDLQYILGWDQTRASTIKNEQVEMFAELDDFQKEIFRILNSGTRQIELERLCMELQSPVNKVLKNLMEMELKGILKSLPGKVYSLI